MIPQKQWSVWREQTFLWFKEQLRHTMSEGTLIDIGSGDGGGYDELYGAYKVIKVDDIQYPDIHIVTDLSKVPWPIESESADIVFAANFFEHIPDPRIALAECRRILKDEGTPYIIVPFMIGVHQAPRDFGRLTIYGWKNLPEKERFEYRIDSVGSPHDVHALIRAKTFSYLYKESPYVQSILQKIYHRTLKILDILCAPLLKVKHPNPHFCLGFCIKAKKEKVNPLT